MKKHIIPLLCIVLLCGCADNTESSADSDDNASVTESTAAIETTTAAKSTTTALTTTTVETQPIIQVDLGSPPPLTLATADGLTETHDRSIFDTLSEPPYYFYTYEDSTYYYRMSGENNSMWYKGRQTNYINSSGEECTDTYFYNSVKETETLINRHINGKTVFVNPCQIYINRQNNALYIRLKETDEIVQKIEGDFSAAADKYSGKENFSLKFEDYDFDDYDDMFLQTTTLTANEPGVYYHFNPETCLFEEWTELNKIGVQCYIDSDKKTLNVFLTGSAVDHETKVYKWDNETLVMTERELMYQGADGEVYIDNFNYDSGTEMLEKRERIINPGAEWIKTEEIPIE